MLYFPRVSNCLFPFFQGHKHTFLSMEVFSLVLEFRVVINFEGGWLRKGRGRSKLETFSKE